MSQSTGFPFDALRANLALQARLIQLAEANGRRWMELGRDLAAKASTAGGDAVMEAFRTGDLQKLATTSATAFWAPLHDQFDTSRALDEGAAAAQTAFIEGLQDALRTWQKDVSAALAGDPSARPFGGPAWIDLVGPWQQWLNETGKQPRDSGKS